MGRDYIVRSGFRRDLDRIRDAIRKGEDAEKITARLKAFEDKYGNDFSKVELAAFHRMRAAVRITAKDYKGALDDLWITQRLGYMDPETAESVAKLIVQLEAIVAAQHAQEEQNGSPDPEREEGAAEASPPSAAKND